MVLQAPSIYGAREGIDCLVIEKSALGGQSGVTERIGNYPGIRTNVEGVEFKGDGKVEAVVARDRATGETMEFHPAAVFVFIGLTPNTGFLEGAVERDPWGFIETDGGLQSSMPCVFAAGDVRAGSTKQLASAVGEGVTALPSVRQHLQKIGDVADVAAAS